MKKSMAFVIGGILPALASCTGEMPQSAATEPEPGNPKSLEMTATRGTWMSVSISPDGDMIVFDLLGDLYVVGSEGGAARRLTSGTAWDIEPRFSPEGERVAFISDRDGTENVWLVRPDGSDLQQVSRERFEGLGSPAWSADGKSVFARQKHARRSFTYKGPWTINQYSVEEDSRRTVVGRTVDFVTTGGQRKTSSDLVPTGPGAAPDGQNLFLAGQIGLTRPGERSYTEYQVLRLDLESGELVAVTEGEGGAFRPEVSPDGRLLAFARREGGMTGLWVRDLASETERRILAGITRDDQGNRAVNDIIPGYSWAGDSQSIVIARDGGIVRIDVDEGTTTDIPFEAQVNLALADRIVEKRAVEENAVEGLAIRSHRLSPDGRTLAFQAFGKIWLKELPDGEPRPLNGEGVTSSAYDPEELFEYAPAWSPNGRAMAHIVWAKGGYGHIRVTEVAAGAARQVTEEPEEYANVAYSPDGRTLVYSVAMPRRHFLDRPGAEIRSIDLRSGEVSRLAATDRGVPAPTFSGDGERIFYIEQTGRRERRFVSIDRQGGDKREHFEMDWLSEAVSSPDGRRVAFIVHDNAYVMDLPPGTGDGEPERVDELALLEQVSSAAASIDWRKSGEVVWGFGNLFRSPIELAIDLHSPRDRPQGLVAFTGARIITMSDPQGGVIENGDLLVKDNRISNVGVAGSFEIPESAHRIDSTGKTIVPGLVDLHAHATDIHPSGILEQQMRGLQADLAYGVTTIHDPAVDTLYARGAAELIETGQALGPRFYTTGAQIIGFSGPHNEWIGSLDIARTVVERRKRLGAISVKEYGQPSRIQRQWIAQAAREYDMRIVTEGTGAFHLPLTAAVDGFTGIEHSIAHGPLNQDVIELLAATRIAYDPVLVGPRRGASARSYLWDWYRSNADEEKLMRFQDPERIAFLEERRAATEFAPSDYVFIEQGRDADKIAEAGGSVVTGSHGDGITLHFDIWGYVTAGMTPLEALHTATASGARALGLERDLGTLERGKLADFVVLNANPLDDIRDTRKIRFVIKNGRVYEDGSLDQVWPERKQRPVAHWLTQRQR